MRNRLAVTIIEEAWNGGYTGQLGPRPHKYHIDVDENAVSFSLLEEGEEELRHICWNCLLLDRDFVQSIVNEDPEPHLQTLVCLTPEQKVKYLFDKISKNS